MVNQTLFHDEVEVYRLALIPGGFIHPFLGTFPQKGTIPLPVTKAGTLSTDNTDSTGGLVVTGVGTGFLQATALTNNASDFQKNRFLVDSNGLCRRIKEVNSDNMITLVNPFPASLAPGTAVKLVVFKPGMITARSVGTANAIMQEANFVIGESFVGGGSPLSYDVSAAGAQIDVSIHV